MDKKTTKKGRQIDKENIEESEFCLTRGCKFGRKEKESEPMILCNFCFQWFHYQCTGDTKKLLAECVGYTCRSCRSIAFKADQILQQLQDFHNDISAITTNSSNANNIKQHFLSIKTALTGIQEEIVETNKNAKSTKTLIKKMKKSQNHLHKDMKETKESVNKLNENVSRMKKQVKKFNIKKKSTEIHEEQFHDAIATFSEGIMACIEEKLGQSVPDKSSRKYPFLTENLNANVY